MTSLAHAQKRKVKLRSSDGQEVQHLT